MPSAKPASSVRNSPTASSGIYTRRSRYSGLIARLSNPSGSTRARCSIPAEHWSAGECARAALRLGSRTTARDCARHCRRRGPHPCPSRICGPSLRAGRSLRPADGALMRTQGSRGQARLYIGTVRRLKGQWPSRTGLSESALAAVQWEGLRPRRTVPWNRIFCSARLKPLGSPPFSKRGLRARPASRPSCRERSTRCDLAGTIRWPAPRSRERSRTRFAH